MLSLKEFQNYIVYSINILKKEGVYKKVRFDNILFVFLHNYAFSCIFIQLSISKKS